MAVAARPLTESTYLLANSASEVSSSPHQTKSVWISCPPSKHLCLPSKAAILILLWTVIVGTIYYAAIHVGAVLTITLSSPYNSLSTYDSLPYAMLAIVMMFYPLSGFIADVCCGRLKTVIMSLIVFLTLVILLALGLSVSEIIELHTFNSLYHNQGFFVIILGFLSLIMFIISLAGYHANFIQLGLDQLFEAPSQYLGLFIHYATWLFQVGSIPFAVTIPLLLCSNFRYPMNISLSAFSYLLLFIFIVLLLIGYRKRRWFHSEPGYQNPYRSVYSILKFAKSHKHPLQRSAFTHCDNYIPSRLDFAKERFGGPFTTEQVENVKTFFRILLFLFMMGPVFVMEVPASFFIFPLFGLHMLHHNIPNGNDICTHKMIWELLIGSGSVMTILSTIILFPGYIWIIFCVYRTKVPKLFIRLGIGIVVCLLEVISLLITDVVGHAVNVTNPMNHTQCVFQIILSSSNNFTYHTLKMHWTVIIALNLLLGVGSVLVIATTLEFISAQSPQSMKGLLIGVFFAIRGLFQFLNSIIIIPLSLRQPWASREMIEHPPVTNCGFVYLLLTSVTGLIGLILFLVAAKRYKYRTRDEGMFLQQLVEEIYDRYIHQDQGAMQQ